MMFKKNEQTGKYLIRRGVPGDARGIIECMQAIIYYFVTPLKTTNKNFSRKTNSASNKHY